MLRLSLFELAASLYILGVERPHEITLTRSSVGATEYLRFEVMFGYYPFDVTLTSLGLGIWAGVAHR